MTASDGASSISVTVRVRPFTIREAAQLTKCDDGPLFLGDGSLAAVPTPKLSQKGIRPVIKVVDDKALVFDPPEDSPVQRFSRSVLPQGKRVKDQTFVFDKVFDENVSQGDVYESTTRSLLDSVFDGYNATVFAYGATGCGKTHTITGTTSQPGIIFLTMQELFERIQDVQGDKRTEISLSYLEIYNETIRDLLEPATDGKKGGLMLREDANEAVSVAGLSSHHPQNVQEVMDMIVRGNELRTMSPTEANATSSRSHAVLQINVSQKDRNADVNEPHTMATLSIIDLAGSERASATKNRGDRLLEGANINKSLLALGSCINALCDPRKRTHVPYRNSKLTRLLKFSLGGNCKTVMIVCVSPSSAHFDETQNTLRYANRAKNIQTKVTRNVYNVNRHVKDFLKKIDEQMNLINELKQQQKDSENLAFAKFRKLSEKREAVMKEGIARLRSAYEHSVNERQERMGCMKKLRQIERRIAMLSSWLAAFDAVCEAREDEEPPRNLVAMKKTAQGVLVELEGSRQHYHQKLSKGNWQRTVDTALQMGLKQLQEADSMTEGSEMASLAREAELLKATAERELQTAVADQEKGFDAALMQVLLQAHFETAAIINQLLVMEEQEAVQAAKGVLGKMLSSTVEATSHVIKPDGSLPVMEAFPPNRLGTPKKRKNAVLLGPSPLPPMMNPVIAELRQGSSSPVRRSPIRRRVGAVKIGLSVTPRRRSPTKRAVRWRDDTEHGALADYDKTPQALDSTPEAQGYDRSPTSALSASHSEEADFYSSSPIVPPPEASVDLRPKSDRFQTGFLTRKSLSSPTVSLDDSDVTTTTAPMPLSEVTANKASGRLSTESKVLSKQEHGTDMVVHNSSDSERSWAGDRDDAVKIQNAMRKRASLSRSNSQRDPTRPPRRPPLLGINASPPGGENSLFTASHARRMVKSDREAVDFKSGVLSPRTTPIVKAFQTASNGRRTTVSSEEKGLFAKPASRAVSGSGSSRLSTAAGGAVAHHASGRGSIAGGSKTVWRG